MTTAPLLGLLIPPAYLIGSIPFGLIVGKMRGIDVRTAGSGNIGATNVGRLLGKRFFFLVFFLDLLKSLLPMTAASIIVHRVPELDRDRLIHLLWLLVGFAAVLGHMFSLYLKFKGGKGVATSAGVVLGLVPYFTLPGAIAIVVFILTFLPTRYVSLGSIASAGAFPFLYLICGKLIGWDVFGRQLPLLIFAFVIAGLIIYKHRTNISRLLAGTENRSVKKMVLLSVLVGLCGLSNVAPAAALPAIPEDARGFYKWIVDTRAEMALSAFKPKPTTRPGAPTPREILPYHGAAEDANMAVVLAAAYAAPWSRLHQRAEAREKGLLILDAMSTLFLDPAFLKTLREQNGLDPQFDLHAFSLAVLLWQETGAASPEQMTRWKSALRALADANIEHNSSLLAGDYANPEFYMLCGLAVTAKVTGDARYRDEARRAIRRFPDALYPGGGMSYFMDSNPQVGYQGMIVLSTAMYLEMTDDPYARQMLQRMTGYYITALHPLGFQPPYESPCLKQGWDYPFSDPSPVRLLACVTGDAPTAALADTLEHRFREGLNGRWPGFLPENQKRAYWYNYHHAKNAVLALRYWKDVAPQPLPRQRVMADSNHRGGRVVWDDFAGFFTTRPFSITRAGCMMTDASEPFAPVNAALAMAIPEALETRFHNKRSQTGWFVSNQRWPHQQLTSLPQLQVMTQPNRLTESYWALAPAREGDEQLSAQASWQSVETFAVLPNLMVGLINLRALTDGGAADKDWARIRFVLFPQNRELSQTVSDIDGLPTMRGNYGKLGFKLIRLNGDDWELQAIDATNQPPIGPPRAQMPKQTHLATTQPALVKKTVPWKARDSATIACAWSPADSGALDTVAARLLPPNLATLVIRQSDTHAWLIAANQNTQYISVQFTPGAGWTTGMFRNSAAFVPSPLDGIARLGLPGESHLIFEITAGKSPLPPPADILGHLSVTDFRR